MRVSVKSANPKTEQSERGISLFFVAAAFMAVAFALTGFPLTSDYSRVIDANIYPDIYHEKAMAWEALHGDPYRAVGEILTDHRYPNDGGGIAPRTPAAFLVQMPLLLVPDTALFRVTTSFIILLLTGIVWMVQITSRVSWRWVRWSAPIMAISLPVVGSISYGTGVTLLAVAMVAASWSFGTKPGVGVLLGVATALRLWPGLMIVGLFFQRKKRPALEAVVTFVLFNVGGLLLPRLTLNGSVEGITQGASGWINNSLNTSLSSLFWPLGFPIWLTATIAVVVTAYAAWRRRSGAASITLAGALITSPLSWPVYSLALAPMAITAWKRSRSPLLAVACLPVTLWFLIPDHWRGKAVLISILILLGLVISHPITPTTEQMDAIQHGGDSNED